MLLVFTRRPAGVSGFVSNLAMGRLSLIYTMAATLIDINELQESSKCFTCLKPGQRDYVETYLLAVAAGGSLDPNTLLAQAQELCFDCLTDGQRETVNTYLRWVIAGSP